MVLNPAEPRGVEVALCRLGPCSQLGGFRAKGGFRV